MNKPTAKHYGVIGSDSVIRAYPADETDAYIAHLEQRAEAAEAESAKWKEEAIKAHEESEIVLAKLAELEKQASEQKPFMYGIMTANGDAHFEDFCVSSDPGLLEDVIWEWNNTLADNEPKNRVVALFTRPAPAINLAELVPGMIKLEPGSAPYVDEFLSAGWNACRAAILRNIEEKTQ